jgi:hypothetical protein
MRTTRIRRVLGSGRWRTLRAGAAALAAVGAVGAVPPAVASASPQQAPNWTEQAPAASPPPRWLASMAYDAATSTAVLFGGVDPLQSACPLADTWTWNGTNWTKQAPAVHPGARAEQSMAYDAATSTAVLFGGVFPTTGCNGGQYPTTTWTWG